MCERAPYHGLRFGIMADKSEIDKAMNTLQQNSLKAECIGKVTDKERVVDRNTPNRH
jgi:hypothetical protein